MGSSTLPKNNPPNHQPIHHFLHHFWGVWNVTCQQKHTLNPTGSRTCRPCFPHLPTFGGWTSTSRWPTLCHRAGLQGQQRRQTWKGRWNQKETVFFGLIPEYEHFEPQNEGLIQMIFLQTGDFQVPSGSCPGCIAFLCVFFWVHQGEERSSTRLFFEDRGERNIGKWTERPFPKWSSKE